MKVYMSLNKETKSYSPKLVALQRQKNPVCPIILQIGGAEEKRFIHFPVA